MLIDSPPVAITDALSMLGTNDYPLFLYRGEDEAAFFEGGTGAMGPLVLQQLQELGIPKDLIKQLVVTHAHPDHVMAIPFLRKMIPGLQVLASQPAAQVLANEKAISFFCKIDGALTASLTKDGAITREHHPEPLAEMKIAIDRTVKDGDTVTIGTDASFTVLATPGHSDCSLSFHDAAHGILFVADATGFYMPKQDFFWPDYFVDYGAYISSLERLAQCNAEILCLSHNGVIKGKDPVRAYLDMVLSRSKEYHQRILDMHGKGETVRAMAEKLGSEVFAQTQLLPLDFFQKNCGLLVKQSLKHAGITPEK